MFSVIVQGKLEKETYDFYVNAYKDIPIIVSTWNGTNITNIPSNVTYIESPDVHDYNKQNLHRQLQSTLKGLEHVTTEYVIKVRGDERYSNLETIYQLAVNNPRKVITTPVFFRRWDYSAYHISDHMLASDTESLRAMFRFGLENYNKRMYVTPEILLCRSFLESIYGSKYDRDEMKQHFLIADMETLKPYRVVANCFSKVWEDDFVPEQNESITSIDSL